MKILDHNIIIINININKQYQIIKLNFILNKIITNNIQSVFLNIFIFYFYVNMVEEVIIENSDFDTQYGVSIACINVNGFATSKKKRMELNLWIHKYDIDVCCVQEWYKLRDKEKFDLDETDFKGYKIHYTNLKTLIIYKNNLIVDLLKYGLEQEGIDITWIALNNNNSTLVIGSIYHSPSFECDINEISNKINEIRKEYNNNKIY